MSTAVALDLRNTWTMPMNELAPREGTLVLSDADWMVLSAALTRVRSKVGRPFRDERLTVEAVIWRARHNARWREIPDCFGPWWRAAQLYYRWGRTGVWERLRKALAEAGREDLASLFDDEPGQPQSGDLPSV
jgi:transposase